MAEIGVEHKGARNYSLDLLRIISMMMIICLHFFSYSNVGDYIDLFSFNYFFRLVVSSICIVSVNCYILSSGYLYELSKFKSSKLFQLFLETFFYSVIIYSILIIGGMIEFSFKDLIYVFLPVLTREYWFVTTYIGLYLFSPFLRKFAICLEKTEFLTVLILGFILFVVYYNFFFFTDNLNFGGATGIVWFIYLYLCGVYLKKYTHRKKSLKRNIIVFLIMLLLGIGSKLFFLILYFFSGMKIFIEGSSIFDGVYNSIFGFLTSITFFKCFVEFDLNLSNKKIKYIFKIASSSSLAVYLLHDNPFIRKVLWKSLDFQCNYLFSIVAYIIVLIVTIYLLTIVIEVIRNYIFKNLIFTEKTKKKLNSIDITIRKKIIELSK